MAKKLDGLKAHDLITQASADDLLLYTVIDHYRIAVPSFSGLQFLTVADVNPYCDEWLGDAIAKYLTPEAAEAERDAFVLVNASVGLVTDAVVVAVNSLSTILMIDGQNCTCQEADAADAEDDCFPLPYDNKGTQQW